MSDHPPVPIEQHTMLSDLRSVALLTPEATVTWWCAPNADDPSVFGDLLHGPEAGGFWVRPSHREAAIEQRYLPDTLLVETTWRDLVVLDYLDRSAGAVPRSAPCSFIRVITASTDFELELAFRPDYQRMVSTLEIGDDGLVARSKLGQISIRAVGVKWEVVDAPDGPRAHASIEARDEPYVVEIRYGVDDLSEWSIPEADRREITARAWRDWVKTLTIDRNSPYDLVRSALTLKALCHEPTGAILAAATTSLPEALGGERNWDYRYCWLRDGSMTAQALVEAGSAVEAQAFLRWVINVAAGSEDVQDLHPLYTLEGTHLGPETSLTHWKGYAGSQPVRIGNAADHQLQLDVFGPIADLVLTMVSCGQQVDPPVLVLMRQIVEAIATRWREPDQGIWELRTAPKQLTHTKVMCWMAVDRVINIWRTLDVEVPTAWIALADAIAAQVLAKAWHPDRRSYTMTYQGRALDAAALWIGLSSLVRGDHEHFVSTVDAIERELRMDSLVCRYNLADDGLEGEEGGFHICATWLAEAYALCGRTKDARELLDSIYKLRGPTGLLPEEYDPRIGKSLGNHPQAYSHIGLMRAATRIGY